MRPWLFPLAMVLALAAPANAGHCASYRTSEPWLDTCDVNDGACDPPARYYFLIDPCPAGCNLSIWLYAESNGIDGLQRGDEIVDDTCHGSIPHDTVIF